jgi:hypothetical protein
MVTDSDDSDPPATDDSIRRKSGRFSSQKSDSADSLSKSGTSSQLAKVRIFLFSSSSSFFEDEDEDGDENNFLRERLIHFSLVEKSLLRLERTGVQDADGFSIRPIHAENPDASRRHSKVEKARLKAEPRRVGQQPDCERILKRLFNFPLIQRTIQIEWRIVPIELHIGLIVNNAPMQCGYIVFTLWQHICQWICEIIMKKAVQPILIIHHHRCRRSWC